jgi:hypothetical protein
MGSAARQLYAGQNQATHIVAVGIKMIGKGGEPCKIDTVSLVRL